MENELPTIEELQEEPVAVVEPVERRGSSLPLILTMAAVLIWFAFQTLQLVVERNNLSALKSQLRFGNAGIPKDAKSTASACQQDC